MKTIYDSYVERIEHEQKTRHLLWSEKKMEPTKFPFVENVLPCVKFQERKRQSKLLAS